MTDNIAHKSDAVEVEQAVDVGIDKAVSPIPAHSAAIEEVLGVERDDPVILGWRTWMVVFVSGFMAVFAQIYTTVAAPSTISFIIMDLGDPQLAVWVIQAPLLIQAVLNPLLGRLSDVLDRKMMVCVPAVLAVAGSALSAKAETMSALIGGGILYGISLATIGIVQTIPAEILPRKYRALSNGIAFLGGSIGGTAGGFLAGVFCKNPGGWRNMFWMQTGLNALVAICLFVFYWPAKNIEAHRKTMGQIISECDPIGSLLFVMGSTCTLMALNWSSGLYAWSNPHVYATLVVGLVLLIAFGLYEWLGRSDGLVSHIFFKSGPNFPLATFAFMIEGWMFYSAVNTVTTQMQLYLGWTSDSLIISVRQLSYALPTIFISVPIIWYATKFKEVKIPLIIGFFLFLVASCAYAGIQTSWKSAQLGIGAIAGIGQAAPLTLLISVVQFTAPHKFLSTATGLAFSLRALGGAFGSAILYTIINGTVRSHFSKSVGEAAVAAGLSARDVPLLLEVMAEGNGPQTQDSLLAVLSQLIPDVDDAVVVAARSAGHEVYAKGYRLAWASIIPFCLLALVSVWCLTSVKTFMTDTVEAPLEKSHGHHGSHHDPEKVPIS